MIWLLLGWLLFGGSATDLSQPQSRVFVMQANIDSVVKDAERRSRAHDIVDRMVRQATSARPAIEGFARRLQELDTDATFREGEYRVALESALNQIDVTEQQLLELRIELRGAMTAEEWTALMANLHEDEK